MGPAASVREQSQIHLCRARSTCRGEALRERKPRPRIPRTPPGRRRRSVVADRAKSCGDSSILSLPRLRYAFLRRVLLTTAAAPASRRVRPHTVLDEMQPALSGRQLTLQQNAYAVVWQNAYAVVRHHTRQRGQRCHRQAGRTHTEPDGHRRMVRPSSMRHRGRALKLHSCSERARGRRAGSVGRAPWCADC